MEEYKEVAGFPGYKISRDGVVVNRDGKVLQKKVNKTSRHGYHTCTIRRDGKSYTVKYHRLLMLTYGPPQPSPKHVVNHIDGNGLNNSLSNLEWATMGENMKHAYKQGLKPYMKGSMCPSSVLDESAVLRIKEALHRGDHPNVVAATFGVSRSCINHIRFNRTWQEVKHVHHED